MPTITVMTLNEYDPDFHAPGSVAAGGHCSWHGMDATSTGRRANCTRPPVTSFVDPSNRRQSGCLRAVVELVRRGWAE